MTTAVENTTKREALFLQMYQDVFPTVATFIRQKGGSLQDAKDVFQDALIAYHEKGREGINEEEEKSYLFGITRNCWFKKYREQQHYLSMEEQQLEVEGVEESERQLSKEKLGNLLATTGKKCLELLNAFYYEKVSMKTVARRFGFSGERSATTQKYKCLLKVRNEMEKLQLNHDDFLD
jgi:RNA polymerase sigma factor (sigma-70 family)